MYIKIYESDESTLVAVCDSELIGTTAREAGLKLEISQEFYLGALADECQVQRALYNATTANIVGRRSIETAISCSAINPDSVMVIDGIPHAQMVRI